MRSKYPNSGSITLLATTPSYELAAPTTTPQINPAVSVITYRFFSTVNFFISIYSFVMMY